MKVIFLKDVPRVGQRHDVKEISDGYAINFLFPQKLAERATPEALKKLKKREEEIILANTVREDLLIKNLESIKEKTLTLKGKANEKGGLFSAIHKREILDALRSNFHIEIDEHVLVLDKPIKEIGEFEVPIKIKNKQSFLRIVVENL